MGGQPTQITRPEDHGETAHLWPEAVPDRNALLFTVQRPQATDYNSAAIALLQLGSGERRILVEGGSNPRYVAPGHIVFARAGNLLAVPFDVTTLQVTGAPVPIVEGVSTNSGTGAGHFATSATGSMAYLRGAEAGLRLTLQWVDRRGTMQPSPALLHRFEEPRLSPDGERLATSIMGPAGSDVWVYHFARQTLTRLTFSLNVEETPVWSPDGKRLAYVRQQEGNRRAIIVKAADGSGVEETIAEGEGHLHVNSWSSLGDVIAVVNVSGLGGSDVYLARPGERKLEPYLRMPFAERAATFSPDGNWMAYASDESGRFEVYVQAFPGPGARFQVSNEGGTEPVWAKAGRELIYRNGDRMMAVAISLSPSSPSVGTPQMLFEGRYATGPGEPWYAVTGDGSRLLILKPDQSASATAIVVVQEWLQELHRLVPPQRPVR